MMDYPQLSKRKIKGKVHVSVGTNNSIGADLHHLDVDKTISSDPGENSKRRTLKLYKKNDSWGFTLQSYGIKHKKINEVEIMTYVDYVDIGGAAWMAGMQRGDVILSVNGEKVGEVAHQQLVNKIRQAGDALRLVVLFEDCCRKVELHDRFIKLKTVLRSKFEELKELELKEMQLVDDYCKSKGLNRFDQVRQSIMSSVSSNSDSWDAYSVISAPQNMQTTGHYDYSQWSSVSSLKSFSMGDNSGSYDEDCLNFIDSESENESLKNWMGKSRASDSDLVMKRGNSSLDRLRINERLMRSSDSALYRRPSLVKEVEMGHDGKGLDDNSTDDVFINGEEKPSFGLSENGCSNKSVVNYEGQQQIYYAGENGNIIVPKICVEGKELYATFDHIDTCSSAEELPEIDTSTYNDKIVAIEIAKEMTKLEKLNTNNHKNLKGVNSGSVRNSSPKDKKSSKASKKIESSIKTKQKISAGDTDKTSNGPISDNTIAKHVEGADCSDTDINSAVKGVIHKLPNILGNIHKQSGSKNLACLNSDDNLTNENNGAIKKSPKSPRVKGPHVGGWLSYEQLKSSVPDIIVSFHVDECQVIYINEKDETTKL